MTYEQAIRLIADQRAHGCTWSEIADHMNRNGFANSRGDKWTDASCMMAVIRRFQELRRPLLGPPSYQSAIAHAIALKQQGWSNQEIADKLNRDGYRLSNGQTWLGCDVCNALYRTKKRKNKKC